MKERNQKEYKILKDEEIIRGLIACNGGHCFSRNCPFYDEKDGNDTNECTSQLSVNALDLINRQRKIINDRAAEILRHDAFIRDLHKQIKTAKTEAIKEFADKLKEELTTGAAVMRVSTLDIIDCLVKEMTEEKNDGKV